MAVFTLDVNGRRHQIDADPAMPLLWVLRDRLNTTVEYPVRSDSDSRRSRCSIWSLPSGMAVGQFGI